MHTYKCTYIQTDNDGRAIEQGASEGAMDVTDDRRRYSIHAIVVVEEIVEVAIA